jgi:hypothetical protein
MNSVIGRQHTILPLLAALACFALACLVLSQTARAADGGLANHNTAEGANALKSLTTGDDNTANGFQCAR